MTYLQWIRTAPCASCLAPGPSQAHHHTRGMGERRGKSTKAPDEEAFPLCLYCHKDFHDASGRFKFWNKAQRIEWQDKMVLRYQALNAVHADEEPF